MRVAAVSTASRWRVGATLPRIRRGDAVALTVLIGVPLLVFTIPALAGYPLLTGDNVIQNYPLRVLAGEILAHGHLPLYNPFAWSGTPLLASANATVAFPDIALFALLPGIVAWVAVEVIAYAAATVGLYCFLRGDGLSPLASGIGGALYGLGGYVSSQAVHLDVVQTAASLAWVLVALQGIGRGAEVRRFAWTALLAVAVACAGLSGNPESEFYAAIGAALFAISVVWSSGRRLRSAELIVFGTLAGACIAAVQVVPADRFVSVSQRATVPYSFLSLGSLRPSELALVFLPHLLGGGLIGLRHYVGGANLAEIDVYPGLIGLVGVVSLSFSLRSPKASRIRVWYVIAAFGLIVALGTSTFIPEVLRHLPVVGRSRLPSRALILPAAAFAVLGGYWCAEFVEPGSALPRRSIAPSRLRSGLERFSAVVPSLVATALVAAAVVGGRAFARVVAARRVSTWPLAQLAPYLIVATALALAVGAVVVFGPRLDHKTRSIVLFVVVALDLLVFTANQTSLAPVRSKDLGRPNRYEAALARLVGRQGRFVIVDHARSGKFVLDDLGAPNLNVFYGIESAQGYGSLTWMPYAIPTGTHEQDTAAPGAFASSVFDATDVRVLLALPGSFESAVRPGDPISITGSNTTTRYFGADVDVRSVCVALRGYWPVRDIDAYAAGIRFVGDAPPRMHLSFAPCGVRARLVGALRSPGVVLPRAPARAAVVSVTVTSGSGRRFGLEGPLAATVTAPHWLPVGLIGPYFAFRNTRAKAPLTTVARTSERQVDSTIRVISSSPWTPTEIVAVVTPKPARLVRDVADIPGWTATIDHGGKSVTVVPRRDGVVQAIDVPAGKSVVTYRYDPPGLSLGVGIAIAGIVALGALIAIDRRHAHRSIAEAVAVGSRTVGGNDGTAGPTA